MQVRLQFLINEICNVAPHIHSDAPMKAFRAKQRLAKLKAELEQEVDALESKLTTYQERK